MSAPSRAWALAAVPIVATLLSGVAGALATSEASVGANTVTAGTLSAPTGVSASLVCQIPTIRVKVTWQAVTKATGYTVKRSTSSGGPYSTVGTTTGNGSTEFTDTTTNLNTTYHYRVQTRAGTVWLSPDGASVKIETTIPGCL